MRWLLLACIGCGRIGFGSREGVETPDSPTGQPDGPAACVSAFEANTLPAGMVVFGGGTVEVAGGRVRVAIPGTLNLDGGVTAMVGTSHAGQATAIQVVAPSTIAAASTSLGWHQPGSLSTHLEMDGTNLKFNSFDSSNNDYNEYIAMPYDPVEHAWWRLRDDSGTVVAEVSPDGVLWKAFSSLPIAFDTTNIRWDFGIGSYVTGISPTESSFDNLTDCTSP